jgi:hypothetical protein
MQWRATMGDEGDVIVIIEEGRVRIDRGRVEVGG